METQVKLNELVAQKIEQKISHGLENGKKAFDRLMNEGKISHDFIAPIGVNLRETNRKPVMEFSGNGGMRMFINTPLQGSFGSNGFTLHQNAVQQVAEKLVVPLKYVNDLSGKDWGRILLATILNTHSYNTDRERVLIRSVGGEVRGVLSDHYRRLNGEKIIQAFLKEVEFQGGVLSDGYMTDTKLWVETILPNPITIPTIKNGDVMIAFGARIATSDYGDGALEIRSFMMQGICLNGAVSNSLLRSVHLGTKLEDNLQYSERTYQIDTNLQCSKVKDLTRQVFNPRFIQERAQRIQAASATEIDIKKELGQLNKSLISKAESDEVISVITNNRLEDGVAGENTLFKLAQGLSAIARNKEPNRKRELEEISGNLYENLKI